MGYSLCGRKESDTTEQLKMHTCSAMSLLIGLLPVPPNDFHKMLQYCSRLSVCDTHHFLTPTVRALGGRAFGR